MKCINMRLKTVTLIDLTGLFAYGPWIGMSRKTCVWLDTWNFAKLTINRYLGFS